MICTTFARNKRFGTPSSAILCCILLAVAIYLLPFAIYAEQIAEQAKDIFTITDILVDEKAEDAEKARKQAILSGEQKAFARLIASLVSVNDFYKQKKFSEKRISEAVKGFEVRDEKITNTSYSANFTFFFREDIVRDMLKSEQIIIPLKKVPTFLIFPVLKTKDGTFLWGEENLWNEAWNRAALSDDGIVQVVVPLGDLEDMQLIKATEVSSGDYAMLKTLASKYGAQGIIIAEAKEKESALDVVIQVLGDIDVPEKIASFENSPEENKPDFFYTTVKELVKHLEEHLVSVHKDEKVLEITKIKVSFANLDGWLKIQKLINEVVEVEKSLVLEISNSYAVIDLYHRGSSDDIRNNLKLKGVILLEDDKND